MTELKSLNDLKICDCCKSKVKNELNDWIKSWRTSIRLRKFFAEVDKAKNNEYTELIIKTNIAAFSEFANIKLKESKCYE